VYTHEKNAMMRHYLKQKAATVVDQSIKQVDQLTELVEVFDVKKMENMLKEHGNRSNLYRNHQRLLNYLGDTAGLLSLAALPADIFEQLELLRLDFPNFSKVIDYYFEQFALAQLSDHCVFSANPLLLVGPPGIGKTFFCHALSKIVGTRFELISLASMTAGFVIGGSSSIWSEGKTGHVVESLARFHVANPLIVVDECDKSGGDKRYDPLGSMYSLLEKETASTFIDESLETPCNCSFIVWIGTANSVDRIPEPILSRFTVIQIERPSAQQMENVLRSIYNKIRENHAWGPKFDENLPRDLIKKIIDSGLEPRRIQKELISACGKAALRHAEKKPSGIYKRSLLSMDFEPKDIGTHEVRMGFIYS
jgi:ATP-dependent Lon protease